MRYTILLVIFIGVYVSATAQKTKCDTIRWAPDVKLTWKDFNGPPDNNSSFKALTNSGMFLYQSYNDKQVTMSTGTQFFSCGSWTKAGSDSLLRHEQLHFDISELYRRKFLKRVLDGSYNKNDHNDRINAIYDEVNKQWKKEDQKYDDETNHGIIQKKQLEWQERIKKELQELEPYSKPQVTIALK